MTHDASPADNSAPKQRGRPFQRGISGNPRGKRPGTRNRLTVIAESLLQEHAEAVTRQVITSALNGDPTCMRLVLERVVAPMRNPVIRFELPRLELLADAAGAYATVLEAMARGEVTPEQAAQVAAMIETWAKLRQAAELSDRVAYLERVMRV